MSLKNKIFSALTMGVAVFAFSTFVSAQETTTTTTDTQKQEKREWRKKDGKRDGKRDGSGEGFRGGRRGGMMGGLRDLNLTDAQKQQIRTIMEANRPDQATMEEMKTLHQAKRDGTLTAAQKERMKALRDQAQQKGEAVHQQVLAVLTAEQRQQLEAKQQEMKQKREERKQMRRERKDDKTDKDNN